jgi:hypothetical protein
MKYIGAVYLLVTIVGFALAGFAVAGIAAQPNLDTNTAAAALALASGGGAIVLRSRRT